MLKQVLQQVLKHISSKPQAKLKQRQGQCLKALVETFASIVQKRNVPGLGGE